MSGNKLTSGTDAEPECQVEPFADSELVLGLIGAVGTDLQKVRDTLEDRLKVVGYEVEHVRITRDVIPKIVQPQPGKEGDEHARLTAFMDAGNEARKRSGDNSILALGAAAYISSKRQPTDAGVPMHARRKAYIIQSLKHPAEVEKLRSIYPQGFYLIGVHADKQRRRDRLKKEKRIGDDEKIDELIKRDEDEHLEYGQRVTDAFHRSDFFVRLGGDEDSLKHRLWRIMDLLFGNPYVTPTFDEYGMFMAFVASLRSSDLSRQVGAVVALGEQVLATGANEIPKAGGGQYWPTDDRLPQDLTFPEDGRDFVLGQDSNKREQQRIIDEISGIGAKAGLDRERLRQVLATSSIRDLTEYGRVVHAEMEAILSCGRAGLSTQGATLYATTFPCHNCAKHIIASGMSRVVFIEPYPKSKAAEFHRDSIEVGLGDGSSVSGGRGIVRFEPFVGVGPRRFFDLFSIHLGSGYAVRRKDKAGAKLEWKPEHGRLRLPMLPASYLDLEFAASRLFNEARGTQEHSNGGS